MTIKKVKVMTAKDYDKQIGYGKEINIEATVARMKRPVQYVDKAPLEAKWKEIRKEELKKQALLEKEKEEKKKVSKKKEKSKNVVKELKKVLKEELSEDIRDTEPKTVLEFLELYGEHLETNKVFAGNLYFGISLDMLKPFKAELKSKKIKLAKNEELDKVILEKYSAKYSTTIKSIDDILEFAKPVKGVCYKFPSLEKHYDYSIRVHSILKLSKWIAVDSRVRSIFTNHRFIYDNDLGTPVLILNEKTNKVDGYIYPNVNYWNKNKGE